MKIDLENLKHHAEESINVINLDPRNPKEYEMFPSAPTDHKFLLVFSVSNPRTPIELNRAHQRFIAQATPHTILKLIELVEAYEEQLNIRAKRSHYQWGEGSFGSYKDKDLMREGAVTAMNVLVSEFRAQRKEILGE